MIPLATLLEIYGDLQSAQKDKSNGIVPLKWTINHAPDNGGIVVEFELDPILYADASQWQPQKTGVYGKLGYWQLDRNKAIDYKLLIVEIAGQFDSLKKITGIVVQYTFDKPVVIPNSNTLKGMTGGKIIGKFNPITGKEESIKPEIATKALKKYNPRLQPNGDVILDSKTAETKRPTRFIPHPDQCIKYESGSKVPDRKEAVNQAETGGKTNQPATPVKANANDDEAKRAAKAVYNAALATFGDAETARVAAAYHMTECNNYKDWNTTKNSFNAGILQWTVNGCDGIKVFTGKSMQEKYSYIRANINNLDLQMSGLKEYWGFRSSAYARWKASGSELEGKFKPIEVKYLTYAGMIIYPNAHQLTKGSVFDFRTGAASNPTVREMATGRYKMPYALANIDALLA